MLERAAPCSPTPRCTGPTCAPLRSLGTFDWITCLDDALNYLLDDDGLAVALTSMAGLLRAGGLLTFDLNSLSAHRRGFAATSSSSIRTSSAAGRGAAAPPPRASPAAPTSRSSRTPTAPGAATPAATTRLVEPRRRRARVRGAGLTLAAVTASSGGTQPEPTRRRTPSSSTWRADLARPPPSAAGEPALGRDVRGDARDGGAQAAEVGGAAEAQIGRGAVVAGPRLQVAAHEHLAQLAILPESPRACSTARSSRARTAAARSATVPVVGASGPRASSAGESSWRSAWRTSSTVGSAAGGGRPSIAVDLGVLEVEQAEVYRELGLPPPAALPTVEDVRQALRQLDSPALLARGPLAPTTGTVAERARGRPVPARARRRAGPG